MHWLRYHWFDLGAVLAILGIIALVMWRPGGVALILWLNLIALFFHQFEEYRWPGTFPLKPIGWLARNDGRYAFPMRCVPTFARAAVTVESS